MGIIKRKGQVKTKRNDRLEDGRSILSRQG